MKKYSELKNQLKEWSKQIRFYKDHRKLDKRGDYSLSFLEYEILKFPISSLKSKEFCLYDEEENRQRII